jgi:glycosyltransferase involved in cell wall biosynthesis
MRPMPLITLGMPVYNEEAFLGSAIESLLAQEMGDFELLVCDNASTDATEEIARRYATLDRRVLYHRNPENVGAARNFNLPVARAAGEYFAWTAGHDLWHARYLAATHAVLAARSEIVMCYSRTRWIDRAGKAIREEADGITTETLGRLARFHVVLWRAMWGTAIHGLMRVRALRRTGLMRAVPSCDKLLLCEMSLQGGFVELPEALFYWRVIRPEETAAVARVRAARAVGVRAPTPYLAKAAAFGRMILGARVTPIEKAAFLTSTAMALTAREWRFWADEVRALLSR